MGSRQIDLFIIDMYTVNGGDFPISNIIEGFDEKKNWIHILSDSIRKAKRSECKIKRKIFLIKY